MKKHLVIFWAALSLLGSGSVALAQHGRGTNGGAGVIKDGAYMTFYSAGLYVEPDLYADPYETVPELKSLVDYVRSFPYFSMATRASVLNAILPTKSRRYLIARPDLLTPEQYADLMAEFKRVTGQEIDLMKLYALTDTHQNVTYIMPRYKELQTLTQREAALMHEGAWVMKPNSTYQEIISIEMSFQAFLESPTNFPAAFDFVSRVTDDATDLNRIALATDLNSGVLDGLTDARHTVSLVDLLGYDYFKCADGDTDKLDNVETKTVCGTFLRAQLADLQSTHPRSFVLNLLASRFDQGGEFVLMDNSAFLLNTYFDRPGKEFYPALDVAIQQGLVYADRHAWSDGGWVHLSTKTMQSCRIDLSNTDPSPRHPNVTCPTIPLGPKSVGRTGYFAFGIGR